MTFEEALRESTQAWKDYGPPGLRTWPTEVEWWWLIALAGRASALSEAMARKYPLPPSVLNLFREGIRWNVRVEMTLYREAGLAEVEGKDPELPTPEEMERAKTSAEAWAAFYTRYLPELVLALRRGLREAQPLAQLFASPPYVRTGVGWIAPLSAEEELRASFHRPGPKPRPLLAMCRGIVLALLPPLSYDGRVVDLTDLAVRVLVIRESGLSAEDLR